MTGFQLALVSLVLSFGVWGLIMRSIFKMSVSRKPRGFQFVMAVSIALAAVALFRSPGVAGAIAAVVAILSSAMFLFTSVMSPLPASIPRVSVGGPMLPFSATDAEGVVFESVALDGRPYLLKFFRGHW